MANSDSPKEHLRLFIAIKTSYAEKLYELTSSLRIKLSECRINWVKPDNFHLTLKFLGNVEAFYLNALRLTLTEIANTQAPFSVSWGKPGFFQRKGTPTVLWQGLVHSSSLLKLQSAIHSGMLELGLGEAQNRFTPHFTLARIKFCRETKKFEELVSQANGLFGQEEKISSFVLVQSHLTPKGPEYQIIEEFKLKQGF